MSRSGDDIDSLFMNSLNKDICEIQQQIYTWKHVLCSAEFLGILEWHWNDLIDGVTLCKYAESIGHFIAPERLQNAANDLRYKFNLITAEETEEWLQTRELSLQDLNDFLSRKILAVDFGDQLAEVRGRIHVKKKHVREDLWPHLVLSNAYPQLVIPLIWRLIVKEFKSPQGISIDKQMGIVEKEFCQRQDIAARDLPVYLESNLLLRDSFRYYMTLEAHYRKFIDRFLTEDKADLLLRSFHNRLIQIEFESVSFVNLERAKEAYFCITEDGVTLKDVAAQAGGAYARSLQSLEEIPEELRRALLSAAIQEAIPPKINKNTEKFTIHRVLKKIAPSLDDLHVCRRLRHEYVKENLASIARDNVKWLKWDLNLSHG